MPWYYAGPEAKPLGPVSAEQLQGLFASGSITSDTFVIEHTGPGAANLAWRRYREVFPTSPTLPPIPPAPPASTYPPPVPPAPPSSAAHPLFPSAAPPHAGHPAYPPPIHHGAHAPIRPTNSWCAWGFALSLVGFCFAFACGIGLIPAVIAVVLCIIGLVQVNKHREEGGMGLAVTGLIFSCVAILIAAVLVAAFAPSILKGHGLTVTEQTSNDSE